MEVKKMKKMKGKTEKSKETTDFSWSPFWDFCGVVTTLTFCTISALYIAVTIVIFLTN